MKISQNVFNLQCGHQYMVEIAMFNVLIVCTSSYDALHLCEVSLKYLERY